MKLNSTMLVGLLVLSSSLILQALSPVQIRKLQEEGRAGLKPGGNIRKTLNAIKELKASGNAPLAKDLERDFLDGLVKGFRIAKRTMQEDLENLLAQQEDLRNQNSNLTDRQARMEDLQMLVTEQDKLIEELKDYSNILSNALNKSRDQVKRLRQDLASAQMPAPAGAGVEPADDNVVRSAKIALDKTLTRVIGNTDVQNLNRIEKAADFTYLDYLYWRRSIGWNAYMTLLYWKNNLLYNELTTKYKEYSVRFDQEKDKGSRVFKEAAMSYLADLDTSGIGKYSARQILPKDELWKYLRAEQEVAKYIDEVRKINPKKADEVVAIAKKYREEVEAEETKAREERDKAHAEMAAEEAGKHTQEQVKDIKTEVEGAFGAPVYDRYYEAGAPA